MIRRRRSVLGMGHLGLVWVAAGGCAGPTELDAGPDDDLLFLVQRSPPNAVMQALYRGRVEVDQEGCFRLAGEPDRHTVVWPFGFRLARDKVSLVIQDAGGREVARVGALLRLGGGEVAAVPGPDVLAPELAAAARVRCPGRYWIAGEVSDPEPR